MRYSCQRFAAALATAVLICIAPAMAIGQQIPAALLQQQQQLKSSSQKAESSGATSIYSEKTGTSPAAPPKPEVKEIEQTKPEPLKQDRIQTPPSGPTAKMQGAHTSPLTSSDGMAPGSVSLDAMRPIKGNAFDRITHAVEQSLKAHVNVPPETPTTVRLSNRDINRITCQEGQIKDVVYSKEKGLMINYTGKDAFIKYRIVRQGSSMKYITGPAELYITCNDHIYTVIAVPEGIPAQIVRLAGGSVEKIKKNASVYGGMAIEKKVINMIKAVYTDNIPDSFTVKKQSRRIDLFNDIDMTLEKVVSMDGEGVQVSEYKARLTSGSKLSKVKLVEKDFLNIGLTRRPVAIAVEKTTLEKGAAVRIFICETTSGGENKGLPNVEPAKGR